MRTTPLDPRPRFYPMALAGQKKYRRALLGLAPKPNTPPKSGRLGESQPAERPPAHAPNTAVRFMARMRAKGKHVLTIRGKVVAQDGTEYLYLSDGTLRRRRVAVVGRRKLKSAGLAPRPRLTTVADETAPVTKSVWQRMVSALAPQHTQLTPVTGSRLVRPQDKD